MMMTPVNSLEIILGFSVHSLLNITRCFDTKNDPKHSSFPSSVVMFIQKKQDYLIYIAPANHTCPLV